MYAETLSRSDAMLSAQEALRLLDQMKKPLGEDVLSEAPPPEAPDVRKETLAGRVTADLQELVLSVLKLDPRDFSPTTPLMDFGLDSVAATEIGNLFSSRFGIVIPPTVFFEFQDLQGFAGYLLANHDQELRARYRDSVSGPAIAATVPANGSGGVPPVMPVPAARPQPAEPVRSAPPGDTAAGTGALLSVEDLWKGSEVPEASSPAGNPRSEPALASPPRTSAEPKALPTVAASGGTPVREPSREALRSMQPYVDRAHILTIARGNAPSLECAIYGSGPPLLLLGGLLMHYSAMWRVQLKELGARYRLIMFHMPGCGNVSLYEDMSLDSLARDVADVLDALGIADPVPVVGCSFGGVLAQAFCLAYPKRCSALAVTVSTPFSEGATDFRVLMRELQTSARFMEVNRGWPMASLPAYQRVIEGFDLRDRLGTLRLPTLVIAGRQDRYTPPAYSRMIYERIPGARWLEISDAGHLLPFTHYEEYNAILLDFLGTVAAAAPRTEAGSRPAFLPASRETLHTLEEYVASGKQGHCVILSAPAAQTALLLNVLCNEHKAYSAVYRSYFLTSLEEAFDAALRLARHRARNKKTDSSGMVVVVDGTGRWLDYFNPLRRGPAEALVPNIRIVGDLEQAESLLRDGLEGDVAALAWIGHTAQRSEEVENFLALTDGSGPVSILVEIDDPACGMADWLSRTITRHPDLVVFGECISGFQAPVAACLVHESVANPWLMTPNEGYVRQPMASFGLTLELAFEYLSDRLAGVVTPAQQRELRRIAADPEAGYEAHLRYGNSGYARVARMHGFDGRFYEARGLRSRLVRHGQPSREIIDCLSNVGSCPRGLNPPDVIDNVVRAHDPEHDYWADLSAFLKEKTGFGHVLPASSQTTALEAALTLGLMAAPKRTKLLCFTDGAGFSLLSAASSFDRVFDLFRKPFQPIYPHAVFIDPSAEDAAERLEKELLSGEIALVWFETIQVEGNAVRPLPRHLIELINRHRAAGGYLVGIDETQTNLWTGALLHSRDFVPSPDIVALGTGLCDSLFPMGAVLAKHTIINRARHTNPSRMGELERRSLCQLSAHIALNALHHIHEAGLLAAARQTGAYFKQALIGLARQFPLVHEVRGEGLLLAIEFDLTGFDPFIQRSFGYLLWGAMLRDPQGGVALVVCPVHNRSLRLVPPLIITREEIDLIVENLRRRLRAGVEQVVRDCAAYCAELGDARTADFLSGLIPHTNPGVTSMSRENSQESAIRGKIAAGSGEPRVCIIGAGVGGINAASALKKKGIPFDCFDKRSRIGGIWDFDPKREHTSVWHSLNMNTPRGIYQFSDFPMPEAYPDFPAHAQTHAYLENYIDHCGIRDSIHLNTEVRRAECLDGGKWRVTLGSGETRTYDFLVVANGHHNTPNIPDYPGSDTFKGETIHSRFYRYRHDYRDKRVMVVGVGNSGAQIAVDVSYDAGMTYISLRRGVYVIPHYMFGIRIDKAIGSTVDSYWFKKLLPHPLYQLVCTGLYNIFVAKHRNMGMPKPDHLMMASLPTVAEGLPNRIGDGKIKIVPEVRRIEGNTVHLADGSSIEVDSIIYSTGYHTDFPFLDPGFLSIKDNYIPLYKRVFMPGKENIAFVGAFQAITWGFLHLMEKQAEVIAEYLAGNYQLPSVAEQQADIKREKKMIDREYLATLRNNYEMHGAVYMHDLDKELQRGRKRARAASFPRSILHGNSAALVRADDPVADKSVVGTS